MIFDVGHGGGSFLWRIAVPAMKEGFLPDSISTDLHISSMNAGMKDMLNVMDKFLAMGMPLDEVIARSTWNPAREIKQDGAGPPVGRRGRRRRGAAAGEGAVRARRHVRRPAGRHASGWSCELTVKDGKVVYDLNGISRPDWRTLPADYKTDGRCTVGRAEARLPIRR